MFIMHSETDGFAKVLTDATLDVLKTEEDFFKRFVDRSSSQCSERYIQYLLWKRLLVGGYDAWTEDEYNGWRDIDIGTRSGSGAKSGLVAAVEMKGPWSTLHPGYCVRKASPDFAKLGGISRGPRRAGGEESAQGSQRVQCYFVLVIHGNDDELIGTTIDGVLDRAIMQAFPDIDTSSFDRSYSQTMRLNGNSQRPDLQRQQVAVVRIP
jgi:hypothetical protein